MRSSFLLLCLAGLCLRAQGQSLLPDPQFGNAGVVVTAEADKTSVIHDILLQPDGKIIAAGMVYDNDGEMNHHTYLVRYLANGAIDPGFGINGKVRTEVGSLDIAYALALQPDGKIVVAGNETIITAIDSTSATITSKPFILRYTSNGTLDATFGSSGIHHLGILVNYPEKYLSAIATRPDGTIIAGGGLLHNGLREMFALSLNANGSYNNSFGSNSLARVVIEPGKDATLNAMALQPDGKLVIAGCSGASSLTEPPNTKAALARLLVNGTPDAAFGTAGKVVTAISTTAMPYDVISSLSIRDGKIIAAGASDKHLALMRYQQNGTPDPAFGINGIVTDANQEPATNLVIDQNGKLLTSGIKAYQQPYTTDIVLARHLVNGAPDLTFGNAGTLNINRSDRDNANKLIAQPDHKIVLGGHTIDASTQNGSFTLFRFMPEGGNTGIGGTASPVDQISIFPNPAKDAVMVQLGQANDRAQLRLINILGQVCYEAHSRQARTRIPLQGLAQGTYLLQATIGSDSKTFKLDIVR